MHLYRFLPAVIGALTIASPAYAADGHFVLPEPSSLFLLGIGVAGVVLGRKFSSKGGGE